MNDEFHHAVIVEPGRCYSMVMGKDEPDASHPYVVYLAGDYIDARQWDEYRRLLFLATGTVR